MGSCIEQILITALPVKTPCPTSADPTLTLPFGEGVAQAQEREGVFNGKLKQKFRSQECRKGFYRMGKCHAEFISASDI